jgi:hypothetical protein
MASQRYYMGLNPRCEKLRKEKNKTTKEKTWKSRPNWFTLMFRVKHNSIQLSE